MPSPNDRPCTSRSHQAQDSSLAKSSTLTAIVHTSAGSKPQSARRVYESGHELKTRPQSSQAIVNRKAVHNVRHVPVLLGRNVLDENSGYEGRWKPENLDRSIAALEQLIDRQIEANETKKMRLQHALGSREKLKKQVSDLRTEIKLLELHKRSHRKLLQEKTHSYEINVEVLSVRSNQARKEIVKLKKLVAGLRKDRVFLIRVKENLGLDYENVKAEVDSVGLKLKKHQLLERELRGTLKKERIEYNKKQELQMKSWLRIKQQYEKVDSKLLKRTFEKGRHGSIISFHAVRKPSTLNANKAQHPLQSEHSRRILSVSQNVVKRTTLSPVMIATSIEKSSYPAQIAETAEYKKSSWMPPIKAPASAILELPTVPRMPPKQKAKLLKSYCGNMTKETEERMKNEILVTQWKITEKQVNIENMDRKIEVFKQGMDKLFKLTAIENIDDLLNRFVAFGNRNCSLVEKLNENQTQIDRLSGVNQELKEKLERANYEECFSISKSSTSRLNHQKQAKDRMSTILHPKSEQQSSKQQHFLGNGRTSVPQESQEAMLKTIVRQLSEANDSLNNAFQVSNQQKQQSKELEQEIRRVVSDVLLINNKDVKETRKHSVFNSLCRLEERVDQTMTSLQLCSSLTRDAGSVSNPGSPSTEQYEGLLKRLDAQQKTHDLEEARKGIALKSTGASIPVQRRPLKYQDVVAEIMLADEVVGNETSKESFTKRYKEAECF